MTQGDLFTHPKPTAPVKVWLYCISCTQWGSNLALPREELHEVLMMGSCAHCGECHLGAGLLPGKPRPTLSTRQ